MFSEMCTVDISNINAAGGDGIRAFNFGAETQQSTIRERSRRLP